MHNTILHKRSSTAGASPAPASLTAGELAVNTADGALFTKTGAGAVVGFARKDLVFSVTEVESIYASTTGRRTSLFMGEGALQMS